MNTNNSDIFSDISIDDSLYDPSLIPEGSIVIEHTIEEKMAHFHELTHKYLGIGADEFMDRWDRGEYDNIDHDTYHKFAELFGFKWIYPREIYEEEKAYLHSQGIYFP